MSENRAKDITTQLWDMANQLRSNMNPVDFQSYILGFMFYRYLSTHQEHFLKDQGFFEIKPDQTINDAYTEAAKRDGVDDYLKAISTDCGYAIKPEDTWTTIVDKVNNGTIVPEDFQNMFSHFNENANLNHEFKKDFRNVFSDIHLGDNQLGNSTNERAKALSKIVSLVDQFNYNDKNGHDILGDVYEYLIANFASNSGKKAGEFYTPHQVSEVLAKIVTLNLKQNDDTFTVYDPAMGSGSLLLTVQSNVPNGDQKGKVHFYGQELNTTTYNLARMNLMMHNVNYKNMDLRNGDTLSIDWPDGRDQNGVDHPRSVDAVVENPPYSAHWDNNSKRIKDPRFSEYAIAPKTKADYAFLLHGLYHLNNQGTMAIVLPHGVLFRGAKEAKIRKALLDKNQIDAVIGLPPKLFYSTSIPTLIMVLKRNRKNRNVLFIDASRDYKKGKNQNLLTADNIDKIVQTYKQRKNVKRYAHVTSMDEIKENDYNLNIPRYVDTFVPEPDINIDEVKNNIKDIDQKITKTKKELKSMEADLIWTDKNKDQGN
ncbi:type I restriction-modification system subunit M [Philodulcilactobacillus myokoensis]|uniref:site-specific DNA-methyltransferase (adenine-specific) n=1 Tax=Philodulcilactobacillus myokoensis TaxID=2929573 RepID=A0A9W6B023_9LACO|nr:type I restriction-modification system subunit M [Philodulcilactobacillus myokoensis]GLB46203.1 type I restriction-modification system subunit M [Philodulcilactobacillus myokoensis]